MAQGGQDMDDLVVSLKDLNNILKCPICWDIVSKPIFVCKTGHHVCSNCQKQEPLCPLCRKEIQDTRNFAAEAIVELPAFPRQLEPRGVPEPDAIQGNTATAVEPTDGLGGKVQVYVKALSGKLIGFIVEPTGYVSDLKLRIENKEGIPVDLQRLIFSGKELVDDQPLTEYKIEHESTIHLVMRLLGGHGLAAHLDMEP